MFITSGSTALFSNEKKAALELVAALEKNLEAVAATRLPRRDTADLKPSAPKRDVTGEKKLKS